MLTCEHQGQFFLSSISTDPTFIWVLFLLHVNLHPSLKPTSGSQPLTLHSTLTPPSGPFSRNEHSVINLQVLNVATPPAQPILANKVLQYLILIQRSSLIYLPLPYWNPTLPRLELPAVPSMPGVLSFSALLHLLFPLFATTFSLLFFFSVLFSFFPLFHPSHFPFF